jgi:hypothetical protein
MNQWTVFLRESFLTKGLPHGVTRLMQSRGRKPNPLTKNISSTGKAPAAVDLMQTLRKLSESLQELLELGRPFVTEARVIRHLLPYVFLVTTAHVAHEPASHRIGHLCPTGILIAGTGAVASKLETHGGSIVVAGSGDTITDAKANCEPAWIADDRADQ